MPLQFHEIWGERNYVYPSKMLNFLKSAFFRYLQIIFVKFSNICIVLISLRLKIQKLVLNVYKQCIQCNKKYEYNIRVTVLEAAITTFQ